MSQIACISFDAFFRNIWAEVQHGYIIFFEFFCLVCYVDIHFSIFYIEIVEACDMINIKGVK